MLALSHNIRVKATHLSDAIESESIYNYLSLLLLANAFAKEIITSSLMKFPFRISFSNTEFGLRRTFEKHIHPCSETCQGEAPLIARYYSQAH
jgi:hypothetical protein